MGSEDGGVTDVSEFWLSVAVVALIAAAALAVSRRGRGWSSPEPADPENAWDAAPLPARVLLHGWPVLGAVVALTLASFGWWNAGLGAPEELPTHWGASGVDATMPRGEALGFPLLISLVVAVWSAAVTWRHRRGLHLAADTAVMCGLFSWIGVSALVASLFSGGAAWVPLLTVCGALAGTVAMAAGVHALGRRRTTRAGVVARSRSISEVS